MTAAAVRSFGMIMFQIARTWIEGVANLARRFPATGLRVSARVSFDTRKRRPRLTVQTALRATSLVRVRRNGSRERPILKRENGPTGIDHACT